jgi:hypothetical protein
MLAFLITLSTSQSQFKQLQAKVMPGDYEFDLAYLNQ